MTNVSFEEALRGLRERFVPGSGDRLARIEELLALLEADPAGEGALRDLMIQFHGFSGAGSTYGFPGVSALGAEGEKLCDTLLKEKILPRPGDRKRWKSLLDSLRRELRGELVRGLADAPGSDDHRGALRHSRRGFRTPRFAPRSSVSQPARGCRRAGSAAARRRWRSCRAAGPTG